MNMSFHTKNPPQEDHDGEYPTFDKVVTVSNCYYYLSLLERFVETTKDMSEDVLKLYLVRAEYRYYKWAYSREADFGSMKNAIPPIDIAFFWQAHMLSPLRFFEDSIRNTQWSKYKNTRLPLKEIHEIDTGIPTHVLTAWKNVMGDEPYHLTQEYLLSNNSLARNAEISCIVCFVKLEIECGLLLKDNGNRASIDRTEMVAIGPSRKIKAMPFNEGMKPLERIIDIHQAVKYEKDKNNPERKKRIMDAIESTYMCNPYRGSSLDLIQAVARQYKFAYRVTQSFNWDLPQGIIKGIRQYSRFLHLIKTYPKLTAVPTIEIAKYRDFTLGYTSRFLNHDDNIAEERLEQFVEHTDHAWKHLDDQQAAMVEAPLPETRKGFKTKMVKMMIKMKNPVNKEKGKATIDPEKLFDDAYHAGTFQTSPAYDFGIDSKRPQEDNAEKYDTNHISFHDKRESCPKARGMSAVIEQQAFYR
ncbi:hypothetical protein MBANPS3_002233 [Mucor bainieri]